MARVSRRRFLGASLLGGAALAAEPAGAQEPAAAAEPARADHPVFFADAERRALAVLADFVLPGAARWGAVEYVEGLLTAFDRDPPRIHPGGPFSGRHPFAENGKPSDRHPADRFRQSVPLDRVRERAWRLRLYGSGEVEHPNEALLGPVVGLRPLFASGAARAAALLESGAAVGSVWSQLPGAFRDELVPLVLEASLGDPIYGGNRDGAGWRAVHFEGDNLPLGYTLWDAAAGSYQERPEAPVADAGPGPGPDPLGFATKLLLRAVGLATRWLVP